MPSAPSSEIVPTALDALQRAPQPLSVDQLRRQMAVRIGPKQKAEFMALLRADPRIHPWPGSGKTPRFWHREPREVAAETALEAASHSPLDSAALVRAIVKNAHRYPRTDAAALVKELIDEGRLFEDPPWGRKRKISATPPDSESYRHELEAQLRPILEKYAALRITPKALVDEICANGVSPAQANTDAAAQIAAALERIEPRRGLVVAVSKLRHAPELAGVSKSGFDAAAMHLFGARRVFLHDHTAPHTLTAAEQDDLIADGKGTFYVGIAWRDPEHDSGLDS